MNSKSAPLNVVISTGIQAETFASLGPDPVQLVEYSISEHDGKIVINWCAYFIEKKTWVTVCHNKEHAQKQINSETFWILWYHVEKYFNQARAIFEGGRWSSHLESKRALKTTENFLQWIVENQNKLDELCTVLTNMEPIFRLLLPDPIHAKYSSCLVRMQSLIQSNAVIRKWNKL